LRISSLALLASLLSTCSLALGAKPTGDETVHAAWAWFTPSKETDKLRILAVSPTVLSCSEIVADWTEPKGIRMPVGLQGHTVGTPEARKRMNYALYGNDLWFAPQLEVDPQVCPVRFADFSLKNSTIAHGSKRFLLPALHPSLDRMHVHTGSGKRPSSGDMSAWSFWQGSHFFWLNEDRFLVLTRETHAYLVTSPPPEYKMKPPAAGLLVPMRLGGNPFLLLDNARSAFPQLLSACRLKDKILVSSKSGLIAVIEVSKEPKWVDRLDRRFKGSKVRCFAGAGAFTAFVKKTAKAQWESYSSADGEKWREEGRPPLRATDVPFYLGSSFLYALSEGKNLGDCAVWRRDSLGRWVIAKTTPAGSANVLLDVAETADGQLYALVGTPAGKILSVSVRKISAK
jgi:hypothetical protein